MSLVHVPLHLGALDGTAYQWLPFIDGVLKRSRSTRDELIAKVYAGEVILHLAYEPQTNRTHALAGTQVAKYGEQLVAEFVWCTGSGRKHWLPLLADLETYHRHLGCTAFKAICRPGWTKELKARGYRVTHCILEKD